MPQLPFTSQAMMGTLILTLTTIITVPSAQESDEAYYKSLGPGYSYAYLQASPTEQFFSTRNLLDCTALSLRSQSEFFTYNKVSHVCKNYSPKNIMTVISTNDRNETSFYRNSRWIKTYTISTGAGSKVYDSFMNKGNTSSWKVDKCNGTFCPNFFRHPILDFWSHLPVYEVKLVIYKNQTAMINIVFDGRNTNLEGWFSPGRLKSSPWLDLPGAPVNVFSMDGAAKKRRFYMSSIYSQCTGDMGWFVLNEAYSACAYELSPHYPTISYSERNSSTTWHNGHGTGDTMAIFIRLKP